LLMGSITEGRIGRERSRANQPRTWRRAGARFPPHTLSWEGRVDNKFAKRP